MKLTEEQKQEFIKALETNQGLDALITKYNIPGCTCKGVYRMVQNYYNEHK